MIIRWSVGIEVAGDRVMTQEEIVELADAVTQYQGIASGIGTMRYGAQMVVFADSRERAVEKGKEQFASAVDRAGLPVFPIDRVEAVSEDEDF
jgi:hypothetical protein